MLASVILPLPERDLKTELSFSVNASNTFLPYLATIPPRGAADKYRKIAHYSKGGILRQRG
jgi:hypothetical protein